jgi:hypothetical protein
MNREALRFFADTFASLSAWFIPSLRSGQALSRTTRFLPRNKFGVGMTREGLGMTVSEGLRDDKG